MLEGGERPEEKIAHAFRRATSRPPRPAETKILLSAFERYRDSFRRNPEAARKVITVGESKPSTGLDHVDLAAWTAIASMILNLDETITKG